MGVVTQFELPGNPNAGRVFSFDSAGRSTKEVEQTDTALARGPEII